MRNGLQVLLILSGSCGSLFAGPAPDATSYFDRYVARIEARLGESPQPDRQLTDQKAPAESPLIDRLTPPGVHLDGAMLHHWRGRAFVPGAGVDRVERLLKNLNAYPRYFAPEVLRAHVMSENGNRLHAEMRVRQHHVITVVLDTAYDVQFVRPDPHYGYSISRSARIEEIASPGTNSEHILGPDEEHGFLWRLNTYWSYAEGGGGAWLQIESVSLTRRVPRGLGWIIGPYVESVPRESMEFTLRSICAVLQKGEPA